MSKKKTLNQEDKTDILLEKYLSDLCGNKVPSLKKVRNIIAKSTKKVVKL